MYVYMRRKRIVIFGFLVLTLLINGSTPLICGQSAVPGAPVPSPRPSSAYGTVARSDADTGPSEFFDAQIGQSLADIVKRALSANGELTAARLEIEKARARLKQARLRPNPTLDVEKSTGRFTGSAGEGEFSVGATLPLEVFGQRGSRIRVAEIDIAAREADIANRERQLTADVLANFAEAMAALQELKITEGLLSLDVETARFVQIRVNEGESPPLELNLLQVEVERLRAGRALSTGKLEASLTKLKLLSGMAMEQPLRLREQIDTLVMPTTPQTAEAAVDLALINRADIRMARLEEELAAAGLQLIRATSKPELSATTRYTQGTSQLPIPNFGDVADPTKTLTFGVSIGLPIFNRNQGAKAEAAIAIRQAGERRVFAAAVVRAEITAAFQRLKAAESSLIILQTQVLPRSEANIKTLRAVYELGEIKITDLIAEQRRLLEANRDVTEALTERFRAQADLQTAIGVPFIK